MKVTPENIFPGAKVRNGIVDMTIIKVNAKSFYATKMSFSEFNDKYEKRMPGMTFLQFCKANEIKSYKYTDDFHIESEESSRKEVAVANSKQKSNALDKAEKMAIIALIKEFSKKKKKTDLTLLQVGNKRLFFLATRDNNYLINVEGDYVLYSPETDESVSICSVYDYNYKEIPWYKLSKFANETPQEEKKFAIA